jgi:adenylyltransferase/sulfurtransferase
MFGQAPAQGTTETCDTAGVIGPIIHTVASHQATEAFKILVGAREQLNPNMVHWDVWHNHHSSVNVKNARKSNCPACSEGRYEYLEAELEGETIQSLCGRNSVQIHPVVPSRIDLKEWADKLRPIGHVELNPFLMKFQVNEEIRLVLFPDGRCIVQGTDDMTAAKSIYSRYVGM